MRERAVATIGLIALVTVGCAQDGDTGKVIDRHQAERTACEGADSLVFGHVITDPETKDLSGREIVLRQRVGAWTGSSRVAAGEFGAFVPLADVKADSVPGPISFSIPDEVDTAIFRGRIYCDSLVGNARFFRNNPLRRVVYPRILASGAEHDDSAQAFDPGERRQR
jgi:hypothetical protein